MTLPLRVSGDLRDVDPALLLRSLSRSRETGRLAVSDGAATRTLHFRAGELLFASSSDPDDGLAAHLVRAGRASLHALARVASRVSPEQRLGAVLVEEGLLGPEELVAAVTAQLLGIVEEVVLAERGRYRFDFAEAAPGETIVLRRDLRALLLEALRRVRSVARVRRGLAALEGRRWRAAPEESRAPLEADAAEESVLAALEPGWEGGGEVPAVAGLTPWETARALWALHLVGAVVPERLRAPTPAPLRGLPPRAAGEGVEARRAQAGPEGGEDGGDAVAAALADFNRRHQVLHRVLRVQLGAGADPFLRACLRRLAPEAAALFEGIALSAAGRWEDEALLARLRRLPAERARASLGALLEVEVQAVARLLDPERARELARELEGEGAARPAGG